MIDEELNGIIKALELCTGSETTCKDCPYRAAVSPSFSVRCEDTLHEASLEAIEALKAENADLRERLAHSLELPYMEQTVSQYGTEDTVLYYMENGKLQQECFNNKFPEQLQAKLAELKGDK